MRTVEDGRFCVDNLGQMGRRDPMQATQRRGLRDVAGTGHDEVSAEVAVVQAMSPPQPSPWLWIVAATPPTSTVLPPAPAIAAPPVPPADAASAGSAAMADTTVLSWQVDPHDATVEVDGKPQSGASTRLRAGKRLIKASRAGYVAKTGELQLDSGPRQWRVTLKRVATGGAPPKSKATPAKQDNRLLIR
jgi:hypothetical protein